MRKISMLLIAVTVILSACSVQRTPLRTLTEVIPAAGASTLALTANVGVVDFKPSPDDRVHVSVSLMGSNSSFFGLVTRTHGEQAARAATLSHTLADGKLALAIQYPANTDSSGINEHWTVELPTNLAVSAHVTTGELNVNGIAGGVDATLNVGKVGLDVPGGPLKITANVGSIKATVHSLDYAGVALATNVGKSTLDVDGVAVGSHQKSGAGDSLVWKGQGKNAINMQLNVGKLEVALVTH